MSCGIESPYLIEGGARPSQCRPGKGCHDGSEEQESTDSSDSTGNFVPNTFAVARTKAVLHLLTIPRHLQIGGLCPLRIVLRLTLNRANDLFFPLICVNPRKSKVSGWPSPFRSRFCSANRPNSIRRVLSGWNSNPTRVAGLAALPLFTASVLFLRSGLHRS